MLNSWLCEVIDRPGANCWSIYYKRFMKDILPILSSTTEFKALRLTPDFLNVGYLFCEWDQAKERERYF